MSLGNAGEIIALDAIRAQINATGGEISLHSAAPGEDGTNAELSGGGYARADAEGAFDTGAASGQLANDAVLTFSAEATADWNSGSTIGYWAAWNSGGACMAVGAIATPKKVLSGQGPVTLPVGALVISAD